MHVLIANNSVIPAVRYGGTERVIWYLGSELVRMGHKVTYLVAQGSHCNFANVLYYNPEQPLNQQIPADVDVVHLNFNPHQPIHKPYIVTMHGNTNDKALLDSNTVFVSQNHAQRYGSTSYVHNGLDWDDYGAVDLTNNRNYFHFLGDAAWRVKNIRGAIHVVLAAKHEQLAVLGGYRLNIRMGFRFTASPRIKFYGMVGGKKKLGLLQSSKGLIFPVRWNEPFGLAITESLYFGCPVLGTPYGSLPEIVIPEVGLLSAKANELTLAIQNIETYSRKRCHEYACDCFNSKIMAQTYLQKYETVLNGESLNTNPPQLQKIQEIKFLDWS